MKNVFSLTSAERSAIIVISIFIFFLSIFQFLKGIPFKNQKSSPEFLALVSSYSNDSFPKKRIDSLNHNSKNTRKVEYTIVKIDLNHCDTSDIKSIPMFGSARAKKVIEYRDQLGGFHSVQQLKEIYILQELEVDFLNQYFFVQNNDYQKIKINSISYADLKNHPYFDAYLAKQVIKYREKTGPISSLEELQKATNAYASLIEKMRPYISFD
jgi:DNA uptake protein ComE-like DNA-binding protein